MGSEQFKFYAALMGSEQFKFYVALMGSTGTSREDF